MVELPEFATVSTADLRANEYRMDASAYNFKASKAIFQVKHNKYGYVYLWSHRGYVADAFYGPRGQRNYIPKGDNAVGFLGSAEMLETNPHPVKFMPISSQKDYGVSYGDVLLSRSGTIGNTTFVSKTLAQYFVSEHAIRICCYDTPGYVYAFLSTDIGREIVKSFTYGAVVDEIEPEHLCNVPIPSAPEALRKEIHDLVVESFNLRDQSNALIDKAQGHLHTVLNLPAIADIKPQRYAPEGDIMTFSVSTTHLDLRLDASYHRPEVEAILAHLRQGAPLTHLSDPRLTADIILPGRFKRIYTDRAHGVPFFGGKQLLQLNPSGLKYLSTAQHSKRIQEELTLQENMIAVSCSGTIGKVQIVPKHWEGWALNQHCMRVVPDSDDTAGYLYAWLDSPYCKPLILRYIYGSNVDELTAEDMATLPVPLLPEGDMRHINSLVLEANALRHQAYLREQEALNRMEAILRGGSTGLVCGRLGG